MSATAMSNPVVSEEPLRKCSATCTPSSAAHPRASAALNGRDQRRRSSSAAKQAAWTSHTSSIAAHSPACLNGYHLPVRTVPTTWTTPRSAAAAVQITATCSPRGQGWPSAAPAPMRRPAAAKRSAPQMRPCPTAHATNTRGKRITAGGWPFRPVRTKSRQTMTPTAAHTAWATRRLRWGTCVGSGFTVGARWRCGLTN